MNLLTTNYIVACADAAISTEITDWYYLAHIGKLIAKNKEISDPEVGGRHFWLFCFTLTLIFLIFVASFRQGLLYILNSFLTKWFA